MAVIRHKMNSRKWISNAKEYIISGKTSAVNAWCLEKNVCLNMVSMGDLAAICYEDNENVESIGHIIAWGKSNMSIPKIVPNCSVSKVSDVYNMKFINGRLVFGNEVTSYVSNSFEDHSIKECTESNYINCLNCNDSVKDFLYEINNSLNIKGNFSRNSCIGYVIFVPMVFAYNHETQEKNSKDKIRVLKDFNEMHYEEIRENNISISNNGKISLPRIIR